jgi:hypothetical protein
MKNTSLIATNFKNCAWNPNSLPGSCGQYWESLYEGIRKTNLIIENVEKYDTPDNPQQDGDLRKRIGEMYFMRGYFHMLLARMYGDITTNLPYVDGVHLAFDHHLSESIRNEKRENHIIIPTAPSAARVVFEYYGGFKTFPESFAEMMVAA